MVILFRLNTESDYGDFGKLFELINNYEIELMFRKLISNTINKMKNTNEDFELEDYTNILNKILSYYNIEPIENKEEIIEKSTYDILNLQDIPSPVNNMNLTANTLNIINNEIPSMFYDNMPNEKQGLNVSDINNQNDMNKFYNNLSALLNAGNSDIYKQLYNSMLLKQHMNNFSTFPQQDSYNMILTKLLQSTHSSGMNLNLLLMFLNKVNQVPNPDGIKQTIQIKDAEKLLNKKKHKKDKKINGKINSLYDNTEKNNGKKIMKGKTKHFESHFLENEKPLPLKAELQKYEPQYQDDKYETCKDPAHSFMHQYFPEMYRLDNFYINIITRKEKWSKRKKEYLVGIKNDYTVFRNLIEEKSAEIREKDMNKVWDPTNISEQEGIIILI
jgi:hypothetical protein